jgi:hypothetical protein
MSVVGITSVLVLINQYVEERGARAICPAKRAFPKTRDGACRQKWKIESRLQEPEVRGSFY